MDFTDNILHVWYHTDSKGISWEDFSNGEGRQTGESLLSLLNSMSPEYEDIRKDFSSAVDYILNFYSSDEKNKKYSLISRYRTYMKFNPEFVKRYEKYEVIQDNPYANQISNVEDALIFNENNSYTANQTFQFNAEYIDTNLSFLNLYVLASNKTNVNKCEICGKYFIPERSSEKRCTNIYRNGRTCRDIGFEETKKKDIAYSLYRREYKRREAEARSTDSQGGIDKREKLHKWRIPAKNKSDQVNKGLLSMDDFKKWLKESE